MKETTKMSRAVSQLEKMYNVINLDKFNGTLPTPIITVQSRPGTYGHCSRAKVWKRKEDETYELNITAESLNRNIEEIIDTLIHEMIHVYCRENDIQEVSRGGKYHNGKFKELAEAKGLTCIKQGQYGWNTMPNDGILEYALSKGWSEIMIGRADRALPMPGLMGTGTAGGPGSHPVRPTSSTRKYQCPKCQNSIRATKDLNIICGDCMERMVKI